MHTKIKVIGNHAMITNTGNINFKTFAKFIKLNKTPIVGVHWEAVEWDGDSLLKRQTIECNIRQKTET